MTFEKGMAPVYKQHCRFGVVIPVGISSGSVNEGRDAYSTSAPQTARLLSPTNELQHQNRTFVSGHLGEIEQKHLD
ncbi:MAG: hypothetical protein FRX49_13133 [Trebouxia sp. A1-2]|nr:MAG: hypothetical protein FRX49_13133 [Trebouxia sp. A1-2]